MQLNPQQIRQLRAQHGWTQQQLAEICGLSLRTIQRVELTGVASLETTKALAVAFTTERDTLIESPLDSAQNNDANKLPAWVFVLTFCAGVICGALLLRLFSSAFS